MTLLEKQSARKCKALKNLVDSGEYSPAYALEKLEEYFDKGICIIERGEMIKNVLPKKYTQITFSKNEQNENVRELIIEEFN